MSETPKIPDGVPPDIWRPAPGVLFSADEYHAFGYLAYGVVSHFINRAQPAPIEVFANTVGPLSKSFLSLRIHDEPRSVVILIAVFAYLEKSGLVEVVPSLHGAWHPNAAVKPEPLKCVVSAGPLLREPGQIAAVSAALPIALALSAGEMAPTYASRIFGRPSGSV
jgi:hypothetical protein